MSGPDYKDMLTRLCADIDNVYYEDNIWDQLPDDVRKWWQEGPERELALLRDTHERTVDRLRRLRAEHAGACRPLAVDLDAYIAQVARALSPAVNARDLVMGDVARRQIEAERLAGLIADEERALADLESRLRQHPPR